MILKNKTFRELDSLRAIAVMMVVVSHWQGRVGPERIPYLWYGVDVFFTISGFLITRILLLSRNAENKFFYLRNFYIWRALRLFPAYYLLIICFFLALNFFSLYIWDNTWNKFYFSYLANWYWFIHPSQGNGSFNHIWSLGVEEQFYLVWPWLIVFLPINRLREFIISCILLSIFLHYKFSAVPNVGMLPFLNLHTLGTGALLGYFYSCEPENLFYKWVVRNTKWLLVVSTFGLFVVLFSSPFFSGFSNVLVPFSLSILTGCLVLKSIYGWGKWTGLIFRNRYFQAIGTISYGIYLYHMPIPDTLKAVTGKMGFEWNYKQSPILATAIFTLLTLMVAIVSYRWIEMPFLQMKSRFTPYKSDETFVGNPTELAFAEGTQVSKRRQRL